MSVLPNRVRSFSSLKFRLLLNSSWVIAPGSGGQAALHWDAVCVSTESTENFVALDRCGIRHTLAGRADAGLLKQKVFCNEVLLLLFHYR